MISHRTNKKLSSFERQQQSQISRRHHHHPKNHSFFSLSPKILLPWVLFVTTIVLMSTNLFWSMTTLSPKITKSYVAAQAQSSTSSLRGPSKDKHEDNFHWVVTEYENESTRHWFENLRERLQCPYTSGHGLIDKKATMGRRMTRSSKYNHLPKPSYNHIPNANVWNILSEAYHHVVDPEHKILQHDTYQKDAWHVPIAVKYDPIKGRGVYAKQYIRKGTAIWSAALNTAEYRSGDQFRQVLEYILVNATSQIPTIDGTTNLPMLIEPKDIVCDSLMWIDCSLDYYTKDLGSNDNDTKQKDIASHYRICQSYDEGVLLNEYTKGMNGKNVKDIDTPIDKDLSKVKGTPNILPARSLSYPKEKNVTLTSICHFGDVIASVDIQAGEELLLDYGAYSHHEGWKYFDLDVLY